MVATMNMMIWMGKNRIGFDVFTSAVHDGGSIRLHAGNGVNQ